MKTKLQLDYKHIRIETNKHRGEETSQSTTSSLPMSSLGFGRLQGYAYNYVPRSSLRQILIIIPKEGTLRCLF